MIINIYDPSEVGIFRRGAAGLRVGVTSGCFDLFHHLHLVYFERCRRLCDLLVVGVDSDDLTRKSKGDGRPVIPEHQRVAMVASQKSVGAAFIMGDIEAFGRAVRELGAVVIFQNQAFGSGMAVAGSDAAEVVIVPDVDQRGSTSEIIEKIVAEHAASRRQPREPREPC